MWRMGLRGTAMSKCMLVFKVLDWGKESGRTFVWSTGDEFVPCLLENVNCVKSILSWLVLSNLGIPIGMRPRE
jgi:hypothetical protein